MQWWTAGLSLGDLVKKAVEKNTTFARDAAVNRQLKTTTVMMMMVMVVVVLMISRNPVQLTNPRNSGKGCINLSRVMYVYCVYKIKWSHFNEVSIVWWCWCVTVARVICQSAQFLQRNFEIAQEQFANFWPKPAPKITLTPTLTLTATPNPDPDPNSNLTASVHACGDEYA